MSEGSPDKYSDGSKEEDLPRADLKQEDKIRVIKGTLLLLLFSSIIIFSLIYCNAPNYNANILFSNDNIYIPKNDIPFYQVDSRSIYKHIIEVNLSLNTDVNNDNISHIKQITARFIFSKDRVRVKIFDMNNAQYEIPLNLFKNNDINFQKNGIINSVEESNIGIHIVTFPFGFRLFRKEKNETFFDTMPLYNIYGSYFIYEKNYMRISTTLINNHLTYGLGYSNMSLRVIEGSYFFWNNWTIDNSYNSYLSIPNYICGNPSTLNFFGVLMFNSCPMRITLHKNQTLTYELNGGIIDLIIIDGPKPRDIIIQLQKTFGMPFIPDISNLDWQGNVIEDKASINENEVKKALENLIVPIKTIWVDDEINMLKEEYKVIDDVEFIRYLSPIVYMNSDYFDYVKQSNTCLKYNDDIFLLDIIVHDEKKEFCIIDCYNPNTTILYEKINVAKNYKHSIIYQFIPKENQKPFNYPFNDKMYNSVYLNSTFYDNSTMLFTHNIFSLKQTQVLKDISIKNNKRGMIYSQSTFIGSEQYSGKWLGYFPSTWTGLKDAIRQTLKFNLLGSANIIHEACGYNTFNSSSLKANSELCVRWIQFSSVSAYSRINNFEILNQYTGIYKESILNSVNLRLKLSLYIYSIMIKNSIEGGFIIMPIFAFYTNINTDENNSNDLLFGNEIQFMLGTNLMISPIVNENEEYHETYFPKNEKMYNFYSGKLINEKNERYLNISNPLTILPIYIRGGFITPIQIPPDNTINEFPNINSMRKMDIQLIVALDDNYNSQGRLFIDDGESNRRNFYEIDFVCILNKTNLEILFRSKADSFEVPSEWYKHFNKIIIYGIKHKPKSIYLEKEYNKIKLKEENLSFDSELNVLTINFNEQNVLNVYTKSAYTLILRDIIKDK